MAVVTLRPSGDGTTTGWTVTGGAGSHASAIVDDPDSNDGDTSYVLSPNVADGTMWVQLDDVPADFAPDAINSITLKVAHRRLNTPNMAVDSGTVNTFLVRVDETTAISTTPTPVSSPIQAGYALTSFTPSPTGVHTVADWNGARLALVFDHTAAQTLDSVNQIRITAAEVIIDYTPASAPQLVTPGTLALALTTFAATVLTPRLVTPSTLSLITSLFAPAVTVGVTVTPAVASLLTATFAPTVLAPRLVTPGTLALTTATLAPTVTGGAGLTVIPITAELVLVMFEPTVTGGGSEEPGYTGMVSYAVRYSSRIRHKEHRGGGA